MSIFLLKEKLSTWKTSLFIEITWTWSHSNPPMHVKDLLWSWRELEAIGDPVVASLLIHQRIYIFYMYKFWREQLQSPKDSYFVWKLWGCKMHDEVKPPWYDVQLLLACYVGFLMEYPIVNINNQNTNGGCCKTHGEQWKATTFPPQPSIPIRLKVTSTSLPVDPMLLRLLRLIKLFRLLRLIRRGETNRGWLKVGRYTN